MAIGYAGTKVSYEGRPEILASEKFVSFTVTVPKALGVVDGARTIVKAGTVFPANDATAKGLILTDIDVTEGATVGSLLVEGYVYKDRLPVVPAAPAITAMTEIKYKG